MRSTRDHRRLSCRSLFSAAILGFFPTAFASISITPRAYNASQYVDPNPAPNAHGKVAFTGFRLDEPYPGTYDSGETPNRWSLELNFTRNIASPSHPEGNVTLITAEMIPPPPGAFDSPFQANGSWQDDEEASDSWRVTILTYPLDQMRRVPDGNDLENGACPTSVLSEQCKTDIRRGIVSDPQVLSGEGGPRGNVHDSCAGYTTVSSHSLSMNENFTRTATSLWEVPMADMDAYNIYGVRTFPFIIVWGHSNTTAEGQRLSDDHVTFACVKVDNNVQPAALPTGGSTHMAARMGMGWYLAGLAGTTVMVMFAL